MTWYDVRVDHIVREARQVVDPRELDYQVVEHYSIPSLEETGQPDLIPPDEILSNKQLLAGGEIMVSRLNPRKARVIRVPDSLTNPAIASGEFIIMHATAVDADYLVYLMLSEEVRQHLHSCVQSVTRSHQRIRPEHLLKMSLRIPENNCQVAIADYLDAETSRIDALVAKKRLLIELLAEYRTALITETVTKGLPPDTAKAAGLDPHPPLKPSGINWLGNIPEHWTVNRLSRLVRCLDGNRVPLNSEQRSELQGPYPYWGANGVVDHLNDWLFDEPLVLLGEDGAPFFEPNKCVAFAVSGKIWVNNHAHVLQPTHISQKFLTHNLNVTDYAAFIDGSTRDKLTQGDMNAIPVLAPPIEEQIAIAAFLDEHTEHIDTLSDRLESAIGLLQEYRTSLITAAVTGDINVSEPNHTPAATGDTPY